MTIATKLGAFALVGAASLGALTLAPSVADARPGFGRFGGGGFGRFGGYNRGFGGYGFRRYGYGFGGAGLGLGLGLGFASAGYGYGYPYYGYASNYGYGDCYLRRSYYGGYPHLVRVCY